MDIIKIEFKSLLGGCTFYLYVIIFIKVSVEKKEEKRERKEEKRELFKKNNKKILLKKKEFWLVIYRDQRSSISPTNRRVLNL